jgi:hypothetical protein
MPSIKTGNATHDANCQKAEHDRQIAMATATTQARPLRMLPNMSAYDPKRTLT